jgi:hypothetical protein
MMIHTPRLNTLLRAVEARLDQDGPRSWYVLAREIGATYEKLRAWMAGTARPNGEMTLALAEWYQRTCKAKEEISRIGGGEKSRPERA